MKKMNLYQQVATLEEFDNLVKRNIYPLVVVLDEVEKEILEEFKDEPDNIKKPRIIQILGENYLNEHREKNNQNEFYIKLDQNRLQKRVCEEQVKLKRFITAENKIQYIDSFFISDVKEKSVMIGLTSQKTFKNCISRGENKVYSIPDLTTQALKQYHKQETKKQVK